MKRMKKYLLLILLITFFSCDKNDPDEANHPDGAFIEEEYFKTAGPIEIIEGSCGYLNYLDRIGSDFETAYDSVIILMNHRRPDQIYLPNTQIDTLIVDYDLDDREFLKVFFFDEENYFVIGTFLDSNGNYFYDSGCKM